MCDFSVKRSLHCAACGEYIEDDHKMFACSICGEVTCSYHCDQDHFIDCKALWEKEHDYINQDEKERD